MLRDGLFRLLGRWLLRRSVTELQRVCRYIGSERRWCRLKSDGDAAVEEVVAGVTGLTTFT